MGNKGKKVSTLARSLGLPTAACRNFTPPLFGLDKELPVCLRFAFSRLYSLSTVHHGAANMCMYVCARVPYIYVSLSLSMSLSPASPSLSFSLSVVLSLAVSVSLSVLRRCSCIVSDKQPHVHTITACEWIHFADTRRGSRIVITAQKASKPSYRESFIILDGTEKGSKRVYLILGKLKPVVLNVNCTTVKGDNEFCVILESSPLKLSESFSRYRTRTICVKLILYVY